MKLLCFLFAVCAFHVFAQQPLIIELKNVFSSDISVSSIRNGAPLKPFVELKNVHMNQPVLLSVPSEFLPGEFFIRFDYKMNENDYSYPKEGNFIMLNQPLNIAFNPQSENSQALEWGTMDKANAIFQTFSEDLGYVNNQYEILSNFISNFRGGSDLLAQELKREKDRLQKINLETIENYISNTESQFLKAKFKCYQFAFQDNNERNLDPFSLLKLLDLSNQELYKASEFVRIFNDQVNRLASVNPEGLETPKLFEGIGIRLLDFMKSEAHPDIYSWTVNYFFMGFEKNGFFDQMPVLEKYLKEPIYNHQDSGMIQTRIDFIKNVKPGSIMKDIDFGKSGKLSDSGLKVLVFWSADCEHCEKELPEFYSLWENVFSKKVDVFCYSVDETDSEIQKWKEQMAKLPKFKHTRGEKGIESMAVKNYSVISTPSYFVLDKDNKLLAAPLSVSELNVVLNRL